MTVIAIDGPAGAGKSTVARRVAAALGFRHLDTGAMYRAVALAALERGVEPAQTAALERLAADIDLVIEGDRVLIDGRDVSTQLRDPRVTRAVSAYSAVPGVRAVLLRRQRELAMQRDVVMEGRDIGAAVVPDAALKIFLTASIRERALRRLADQDTVQPLELAELETSIAARDEADATRTASPFVRAPDAVVVDSTGRDVEGVVAEVLSLIAAQPAQ
ncbi:MAG: (d)CMP kinase [Actinomycetota bacterium]|nr:(d)CMP kinase [Actinomycetota bacterium]